VLKEPDVGGVADPGAADDEIEDGGDAAEGPDGGGRFFHEQGENQIGDAGESHLPGDGAEGIGGGGLPLFGEHGTESPTEGTQRQRQRPQELAMAQGIGVSESGQMSTIMPTMPMASPSLPRRAMWWSPNSRLSSTRNQSGVLATSSADKPVGTICSA